MKTYIHKSSVKYYSFVQEICEAINDFKNRFTNHSFFVSAQLVNEHRSTSDVDYHYNIIVLCLYDKGREIKDGGQDLIGNYDTICTFSLNWHEHKGLEKFKEHMQSEMDIAAKKVEIYLARVNELNSVKSTSSSDGKNGELSDVNL